MNNGENKKNISAHYVKNKEKLNRNKILEMKTIPSHYIINKKNLK